VALLSGLIVLLVRSVNIMEHFSTLLKRVLIKIITSLAALLSCRRCRLSSLVKVANDHDISCSLQILDAQAEQENYAEGGSPRIYCTRTEGAFQFLQNVHCELAVNLVHYILNLLVKKTRRKIWLSFGVGRQSFIELASRLVRKCYETAHKIMNRMQLKGVLEERYLASLINRKIRFDTTRTHALFRIGILADNLEDLIGKSRDISSCCLLAVPNNLKVRTII
jgi:hypothetical protein